MVTMRIGQYSILKAFFCFYTVLCAMTALPSGCAEHKAICGGCHEMELQAPIKEHHQDCALCHGGDPGSDNKVEAHRTMTSNPADLSSARNTCGQCHPDQVSHLLHSLHGTNAGEINLSRYWVGAQKSFNPPIYSITTTSGLKILPHSPPVPTRVEALIDDLLRKRCLRCHPSTLTDKRTRGCMACHLQPSDMIRGRGHNFTKKTENEACFRCHRQNYVGQDYSGKFFGDYGKFQGAAQNRIQLQADLHHGRGMWCIDCHNGQEIMGSGLLTPYGGVERLITCEQCHVPKSVPDHGAESLLPQSQPYCGPGSGKNFSIPMWQPERDGHNIKAHHQVRCESCHAAWCFGDFGQNIIRLDHADYFRWSYLLPQGITWLDNLFKRNLSKPYAQWEAPTMPDLLTAENKPGIWLQAWDFKRFEISLIGLDARNKIGLLRPFMQLSWSYVNAQGLVLVDNVHNPGGFDQYTPHTIQRSGYRCERCHGNTGLTGLSNPTYPARWQELTKPGGFLTPGTKLLPAHIAEKLSHPSAKYKQIRSALLP
ncbi:hypothetical protein ACFL27_01125 [candidate division CSSED10-310 bacterium]|uniref:Cytochrome c-552/4 domain-containing protein n=1 Tax=candidate division CSSED10-310 bacterium TaxID=2855610 RepID=A0ABV6YRF5_UNCC1